MRKRNSKFVLILFTVVLLFCMNIGEVKATDAELSGVIDGDTVEVNGHITYLSKKIGGKTAYCLEVKHSTGANGATYTTITSKGDRYSEISYIGGQIIKIGKETGKSYADITGALNCEMGMPGRSCNRTDAVKSIIKEAKDYVEKYEGVGSKNSKLPKVTIKSSTSILSYDGSKYKSGKITISGLTNEKYGSVGTKYTTSTVPTYKLSVTSSSGTVKLCKDESGTDCLGNTITSNGTYYVILTGDNSSNGKVSIKINGSNTSIYPSGIFWKFKSGNVKFPKLDKQHMMTYGTVKVSRTISQSLSLNYSATNKYSAGIMKVDDTGEPLKGASLKLFTADNEDGTGNVKDLCTTDSLSDDSGCSVSNIESTDVTKGYTDGRYICYSEETTPVGYVKIPTNCEKISLSASGTSYYKIKLATEGENEIYTSIDSNTYDEAKKFSNSSAKYKHVIGDTELDPQDTGTIKYYLDEDSQINIIQNVDAINDGKYEVCSSSDDTSETGDSSQNDNCTSYDVQTSVGTAACYSDETSEWGDIDYCKGYRYDSVIFTSGSYYAYVGNQLNYVKIGKRDITGVAEIPGATMAVYKSDGDGKCTNTLATSKEFIYTEYKETVDDSGSFDGDGSNSGDTSTDNTDSSADDTTSETVDDAESVDIASTGLTWISSYASVAIYGLAPGSYCLKETIPASGYKKTDTVVEFSMDESGVVTTDATDNYDKESNTLFLKNELNSMTISKDDVATSKELPGATLELCSAFENEDGKYEMIRDDAGNCANPNLATGDSSSWVSTDEPHVISGLPAGAYYLVETIAPKGYSTAESILFIMNEDGTVTDENGKSLADNKLVMHDKIIEDVKTGDIFVFIVAIICVVAIAFAIYYYNNYDNNTKFKGNRLNNKLRGRKIYR